MGCSRVGEPYFLEPSDRHVSPNDYTTEIEARLNRSAASEGGIYVTYMMFAAFGYVLSDVCADGVVVELAQREPLAERGRTQSTIYATRTFAATVGQILTGVAFNGAEYGGSFDFSLTFPQLMLVLAVCVAPIIPVTWLYIEESTKPPVRFSSYVSELWYAMKTRAVYQVVFYAFFSGIFANFSYTAGSPIQLFMVGVTPINNTISDILGSAVFMAGIMLTGKYGLAWNWRTMTVLTGAIVIAVDAVCTFVTVWDVYRSQWLWLGLPIAVNVPAGISFLIGTFVTVELVGEGHEGAMYGLLTTVANLSAPFATTLTKVVDNSLWDLSNERVQVDDYAVRRDITGAVLLMYGMSAISWLFLFLLPKQKKETQELKQSGGSSALLGALTVGYLIVALLWSVTANIMGIIPSTSCLLIAGGSGC
uniref:Major facilitator superfamily (MFS) profile domain-containing protein n=1 Tax=Phytophthora ramorum TaxID=164328 RepID=H3GRD3_PHYRM